MQTCVALLVALLLVVPAGRTTRIVAHARAGEIVALFGDSWRRPIGDLRVTGGRIDGGRVEVYFAGPGRSAAMTMLRRDSAAAASPADTVVEQPGNDIVAVLACDPACDAVSLARLRGLADRVLAGNPGRFWVPVQGFARGRERELALALALALCGAAVWPAFLTLRQAGRLSVAAFAEPARAGALTLAVTLLLGRPTLTNWYVHNLPASGGILEADDRNGVAGFFVQAAVRALLPWTDVSLFTLNLLLHALAGAAYFAAFRGLSADRAPAARSSIAWLAVLFWALLPMSVRIGWSDALHVQVDLLFACLLLAWVRAQDERHAPERVLTPLLAALLPLVRLEAFTLAPLPLIFGPLAGNRRVSRRFGDAVAYVAMLAMAVAAVVALFMWRSDAPMPGMRAHAAAALAMLRNLVLLRQFLVVDSGLENWFPFPATVLLAAGGIVLLIRRPALLAACAIAFCLPQLLLDRTFNSEGIVGARYFLPLIALLSLVAAHGLAAGAALARRLLAAVLENGIARRVAQGLAVVVTMSIVPASWQLYRHEYAFQEEYRFLRRALAKLPADARVLYLPVREDDALRNDPDCCLDPPHCPLAQAFPRLRFEAVSLRPDGPPLPKEVDGRTYYYQGALCGLAPTRESENRNPGLAAEVQRLCAILASDPRLEPVDAEVISSNGFWRFLEPGGVPVRLYRIRPRAER